jgi:urease accessory protein
MVDGLMHPVFGVDHLLAMVSVGVVSVQLGGANIWRLPLAFVVAMTIGGVIGTATLHILGMIIGEVATMRTWLRRGLRLAGALVAVWGGTFLVQTLAALA